MQAGKCKNMFKNGNENPFLKSCDGKCRKATMECNGICDREQCALENRSCAYMVDMVEPPLALHGTCYGKCTKTIKMTRNEKGMNFTTRSCHGVCENVAVWGTHHWEAQMKKKKMFCNYKMIDTNNWSW